MEGPTAIRSQTPDWRHTHTGAGTINSNNIPSILTPYQHQQIKSTKSHSYLPSLAHLDLAKILRDGQLKNGNEIKHLSPIVTNITTTTTGTKTTDQINSQPLSSPVGAYPGPPPPYSSLVTTSTSGAMGNQTTYASQHNPELRRTNNGEKEHHQVLPSLPSIHEALGKEPGPFYRTTPRLSSIPKPTSMLISSPTNSIHSIHAHAPNHYDSHMSRPTDPPPPPPPPPSQRPIFETPQRDSQFEEPRRYHHPEPQSAHRVPPVQSPHIHLRPQSQSQPTTPSFFPAPSRQNGQNGPTSQSGPHYETSHPPAYSYPPPSSHTIQAPSLTGNRRNDDYPRSEDDRRTHTAGNSINSSKGSPGPFHHGESVKRHLETFDLELGLNEVSYFVWAGTKTLNGELTTFFFRFSDCGSQ